MVVGARIKIREGVVDETRPALRYETSRVSGPSEDDGDNGDDDDGDDDDGGGRNSTRIKIRDQQGFRAKWWRALRHARFQRKQIWRSQSTTTSNTTKQLNCHLKHHLDSYSAEI